MTDFARLTAQDRFSRDDLVEILGAKEAPDLSVIRRAAEAVLLERCGPGVYLRGLVEFLQCLRQRLPLLRHSQV